MREVFHGTDINVTVHRQKHLPGAALGSREYLEEYVNEKISNWVNEVTQLAKFALSQPQASYAAYTFGLTYFLRTLPDIQDLLEPLEKAISQILIPAITDHQCNPLDRDILALPARLGGLGLENPSHEAEREYVSSKKVTVPLVDQIVAQLHQLPDESHIKSAQQAVRKERVQELEERAERIRENAPPRIQRILDVASEKGSSVWLTALPLKEQGFNLN